MLNLFKPRSLGARIIAINFIGLILLALGFIYVDKSEDNLVKARIEALLVQANLFAFSFDFDPEIRDNFWRKSNAHNRHWWNYCCTISVYATKN